MRWASLTLLSLGILGGCRDRTRSAEDALLVLSREPELMLSLELPSESRPAAQSSPEEWSFPEPFDKDQTNTFVWLIEIRLANY